ncbi:hypothetical protein [Dactylosporangium sp. CA-152071]|uniref:hypothetical protein n=1 Tax=Dactylosporangium sp. CA-152071 TaxID=3239933 RepID=UPI003D933BE8
MRLPQIDGVRVVVVEDLLNAPLLPRFLKQFPPSIREQTFVDARLAPQLTPGTVVLAANQLAVPIEVSLDTAAGFPPGTTEFVDDYGPMPRLFATGARVWPSDSVPSDDRVAARFSVRPGRGPDTYDLGAGWLVQIFEWGVWVRPARAPAALVADVVEAFGGPPGRRPPMLLGVPGGGKVPAVVLQRLLRLRALMPPRTAARLRTVWLGERPDNVDAGTPVLGPARSLEDDVVTAEPGTHAAPTPAQPVGSAPAVNPQQLRSPPSTDRQLRDMAAGLPANLRVQRAVGGTLLHAGGAGATISSRVPEPTGPGPAILLDPTATDPAVLGDALAGLRPQDTTLAVLHWPQDQRISAARARQITTLVLDPQTRSAVLSVPREALADAPGRDDPLVVPLDADGEVTFFNARPQRYLYLPAASGAWTRPAPYGLPEVRPGVYQLSDGWVVWDGGSHLWIGPAAELVQVEALLPRAGGRLAEPTVFLGWGGAVLPPRAGAQVGRVFAGMPQGVPARLITSGVGLDRHAFDVDAVMGLPGGVRLSHVPAGVLAHTGPPPMSGATAMHWGDLSAPDRPRLVVHESVADPVAVVRAVQGRLGSNATSLRVLLAVDPPAPGAAGRAVRVAEALRRGLGGSVELVLPVSAVGRSPAGAAGLVPVDTRGRRTLPAAAHAYLLPARPVPVPAAGPLGLRPATGGGYRVMPGWTVTEHNGAVLFAEHGTDPGVLPLLAPAQPPGAVTVVVQPRGGAVPPEVAAVVSGLLSGVPEADRQVYVHAEASGAGPVTTDAPAQGAPGGQEPAIEPEAAPNRLALALGDPKATLPDLDRVEKALRDEATRRGLTVPAADWEMLHQRLLNNYPQLISPDGYLFALGGMEVRVELDPADPRLVGNPAGSSGTAVDSPSLDDLEHRGSTEEGRFHANELVQGVFQTGAHGQGDGTTMRANRVRGDLNFDVPLGPSTHFGPKVSFTANRTDQKSSYLIDAEKGRVMDTRSPSTFYSYLPGWGIETRDDTGLWEPVEMTWPPGGPEPARLVVAIPDHLLADPAEQVVADLPAVDPGHPERPSRANLTRLPETFSASNLTGLTELYDHIVSRLRADGFDMSISSPMRQELQRKLWNTETHLDEAINRRSPGDTVTGPHASTSSAPVNADVRGYRFTLHEHGKAAATIRVHARRHGATGRVGSTSDAAHIEKVRTAIVGHGGEFTLGQSTAVSFGGSLELPLAKDYGDPAVFKHGPKIGLSAKGGVSWNSNDGGGATHVSLNVMVSRYTGQTGGHTVELELSADVSTSRRPTERPRTTPAVDGSVVVRLSEPDAFAYGFGVDAGAFTTTGTAELPAPPASGRPRTLPYRKWSEQLRNTGKHPEDSGGNLVPRHVLAGRGLGQSLAEIDPSAVAQLQANLRRELVASGFLPPDGDRIWSRLDESARGPEHARTPATADLWDKTKAAAFRGQDAVVLSAKEAVARDIDAWVDNLDLVDKLVSNDGLESHFDTLTQDGLTFTLHSWRNGVMRTAEVTVHARSQVTDEVGPDGNSVHFDRLTDEYHVVNLSMALGIEGQGAGGTQGWSLEGGLKLDMPQGVAPLESMGIVGGALSRSVGGADRLTRIVNRPELLEYPGRVGKFDLPFDFSFTVRYDNRAAPHFSPPDVRGDVHAVLLDLNSDPSTFSEPATGDTAPSVLHHSVVYYLDTHGLSTAIRDQLPDLTRAGHPMAGPLASLANLISVQSHFKEALYDHYSTDLLVEPGLFANANAAASIGVDRIGPARFVGATSDKYIIGLIELYLAETANTSSRSSAKTVSLPNVRLGHKFAKDGRNLMKLGFSESVNGKFSESSAEETKRTGGLEMIKLAFNRAYAFLAPVDYSVRTGTRTQTGFVFSSNRSPAPVRVPARDMIFLLPEPEALARYAEGQLPLSERQLVDAMGRWAGGELTLPGNTVAGLLHRWWQEVEARAGAGTPDAVATVRIRHEIQRWAQTLAIRHNDHSTRDVVLDEDLRRQFRAGFGAALDPGKDPFRALTLPAYMTRTGDRSLGHSGVDELTLFTGPAPDGGPRPTTTLLDAVVAQVRAVAPGLLGSGADAWHQADGSWGVLMFSPGRQIFGTLPGALESLQAILAGQRANVALADMLHQHNAVTFYFVDRKGGLLADVVEVQVSAALEGRPYYTDWVPDSGIENYGHAYAAYATNLSRSLGWNITAARFGFSQGGSPVAGSVSASYAPQGSRNLKRSEQATREQTVYDWAGHYRASTGARITIGVRRLKMASRPLHSLLSSVWDGSANLLASAGGWADASLPDPPPAGAAVTVGSQLTKGAKAMAAALANAKVVQSGSVDHDARLDFKVPRGLAEATAMPLTTTLDLRPLPPLPGDAYVSGALVDDLFPAARKLMARVLGSAGDDEHYRGSVALPGLLSRLSVDNHLPDMVVENGYTLASHLFNAGASNSRVAMRLYASLHGMEIVSSIVNSTGTGRYAKFQVGAAATQSRNRWRVDLDGDLSGAWSMQETHVGAQDDTRAKGGFTIGGNRNAPMSHSATYADNKRNETHVKMQGAVYLVKLRGRFRLAAVAHTHSPFVPAEDTGPIGPERFGPDADSTGWITGDVYVEMFADEVRDLQRQMSDRPQQWNLGGAGHWPAPAPGAHQADLDQLLEQSTPAAMAAGAGATRPATRSATRPAGPAGRATGTVAGRRVEPGDFDPGQAAAHTALLIRDQLGNHYGAVLPFELSADARTRSRRRYELLLDWAVRHLGTATPAQQAAADLAELTTWQGQVGAGDPPEIRQADERAADIMRRVERVQPAGVAPPEQPHEVQLLNQDPMTVARGVAFELGTHVDFTAVDAQGTVSRYRIDPEGRVVELRVQAGADTPITYNQVLRDLPASLRRTAREAGIDSAQQRRIYEELLEGTAIQMEAAAGLEHELRRRIQRARANADDGAGAWIAGGLPRPAGSPPAGPAHDRNRGTAESPDSRAARARQQVTTDLPPGWSSTGPLHQLPGNPLPGTRMWIARPQGAVAAYLHVDGDYRVHDPLTRGGEQTMTAAAFRQRFGTAQAVTVVAPDVLHSWLAHDGDWAASQQFAQHHLTALLADANAASLAQEQQRATELPPGAPPGPGDPVLNRHRPLLDAIRNGQLAGAYRYLTATTPAARLAVLTGLLGDAVTPTPAALRAMADLAMAAPSVLPSPAPVTARDAAMLRAVASILDPSAGAIERLRAIAVATSNVPDPRVWATTLQHLAGRVAGPGRAADLRALLDSATDPTQRMAYRHNERTLAEMAPEQISGLTRAVVATGLGAAALARLWHTADDAPQLLAAVQAAPPGARPAPVAPATVTYGVPPVPATLERWIALTDWGQSRAFLDAHRSELLSDPAHRELQRRLAQGPAGHATLTAQDGLLTLARYGRIEDGYRYLTGAVAPVPAPAGAGPTARQRFLHQLLIDPEFAEPAAVGALAKLAAALPGPLDRADAAILRIIGDALAGLTVGDAAVTDTVRRARETLSEPQRQQWATTVRGLAATRGAPGAALQRLSKRLYPAAPPTSLAAPTGTARQDALARLHQTVHDLQAAQTAMDQARQARRRAETDRDAAAAAHEQARTALADVLAQARSAEDMVRRRTGELPGLQTAADEAGDAFRAAHGLAVAAEADRDAAPDDTDLRRRAADLRDAAELLRQPARAAQRHLSDAQDAAGDANALLGRLDAALPGLRQQVRDTGDVLGAREAALHTHDQSVEMSDRKRRERTAARDAAQAVVDAMRLADPPPDTGTVATDLDGVLADLARVGHDTTTVVPVLATRLGEQAGGAVPPRLVLSTDQGWQPAGGPLPSDEAAVTGLDRKILASQLAGALHTMIELRVTGPGSRRPRSYLAYPSGEVVRLNSTGGPEDVHQAIQRLPQHLRDMLGAYQRSPDLTDRLEILHQRQIENRSDFAASVTTLVEHASRDQPLVPSAAGAGQPPGHHPAAGARVVELLALVDGDLDEAQISDLLDHLDEEGADFTTLPDDIRTAYVRSVRTGDPQLLIAALSGRVADAWTVPGGRTARVLHANSGRAVTEGERMLYLNRLMFLEPEPVNLDPPRRDHRSGGRTADIRELSRVRRPEPRPAGQDPLAMARAVDVWRRNSTAGRELQETERLSFDALAGHYPGSGGFVRFLDADGQPARGFHALVARLAGSGGSGIVLHRGLDPRGRPVERVLNVFEQDGMVVLLDPLTQRPATLPTGPVDVLFLPTWSGAALAGVESVDPTAEWATTFAELFRPAELILPAGVSDLGTVLLVGNPAASRPLWDVVSRLASGSRRRVVIFDQPTVEGTALVVLADRMRLLGMPPTMVVTKPAKDTPDVFRSLGIPVIHQVPPPLGAPGLRLGNVWAVTGEEGTTVRFGEDLTQEVFDAAQATSRPAPVPPALAEWLDAGLRGDAQRSQEVLEAHASALTSSAVGQWMTQLSEVTFDGGYSLGVHHALVELVGHDLIDQSYRYLTAKDPAARGKAMADIPSVRLASAIGPLRRLVTGVGNGPAEKAYDAVLKALEEIISSERPNSQWFEGQIKNLTKPDKLAWDDLLRRFGAVEELTQPRRDALDVLRRLVLTC